MAWHDGCAGATEWRKPSETQAASRTFSHTGKADLCGMEPGRRACPIWDRASTRERTGRKSEQDPLTPESRRRQTWPAGRQKSEIRCRRLSRYDVRKMLVRLGMHRVFNELGDFTAEQRRVGRRLCREVHAVGMTGEDYVRSIRARAHSTLARAATLKPGQGDSVPGCHRRPLAPGGAILTAVEGQQLARRV